MRRSPLVLLGVLLLLCGGAAWWQKSAVRAGGLSAPAGASLAVLSPLQRALNGVGGWFSDVGHAMIGRGGAIAENEEMRARVADLEGQNQRLLRYRRENEELHRLLNIPAPNNGRGVAAEVVALDATDFARRIVLNVGARQGVRIKDMVYTGSGVVGQVAEVGPLSCRVMLLTDRQAAVGAMTSRTFAKGVVQGSGERICKMSYLDFGADVREGDVILTSGIIKGRGAIFPKGMVVGRVLKVVKDKTYSQTNAFIDPAVPFDRLSAVWVRVGA